MAGIIKNDSVYISRDDFLSLCSLFICPNDAQEVIFTTYMWCVVCVCAHPAALSYRDYGL